MQNIPFPFNQKQHIFDFKVKVNFESGNVSLTAPQIVTPPARFGHQQYPYYNTPQIHPHSIYTHNITDSYNPHPMISYPPNNLGSNLSQMQNQQNWNNQNIFTNVNNIELVNSSYASLRQGEHQLTMNNSIQTIECVLCQKSFDATQFDRHLELHKNRVNKNNISQQKGNVSNYAKTQNSFSGNNDSVISVDRKSNYSFQNESFHSQNNLNRSVHNESSQGSLQQRQGQKNIQPTITTSSNQHQSQSFHLLGRIQNPILAIKAQQQSSLSHSSSSHPNNSLNYSNSYGQQSTTRFNNPLINQQNSSEQTPQLNHQLNNSSFGNNPGNNVIGPSFFHNSSHESGNMIGGNVNGQFFKGVNRLAYNDVNGSIGSHSSFNMQVPIINNPIQNQSYHSNHPNAHPSQLSHHSNHSNHSHHSSNPSIQIAPNMNNSQQFSHHSNQSMGDVRNSQQSHHSSPYINTSLHANFAPLTNTGPMFQNFQTIESRYMNQPASNSRQLYGSYQQISHAQRSRQKQQQIPFSQSDISSISYSSRADLSQYSDWQDFKHRSQQKLQGYNSADNSIIKNRQNQKSPQQNNIYLSKQSNQKHQTDQNFFKKKKDHMINSATSYYEKKFKDEESSSDQQDTVYKAGRMSYAQRLKEKRISDNLRSSEMSQGKNNVKLKQSARSMKSNNLSKCSDDSNMSKTKLPVNYLAREEFISTSFTSKSTHKTDVPPN